MSKFDQVLARPRRVAVKNDAVGETEYLLGRAGCITGYTRATGHAVVVLDGGGEEVAVRPDNLIDQAARIRALFEGLPGRVQRQPLAREGVRPAA